MKRLNLKECGSFCNSMSKLNERGQFVLLKIMYDIYTNIAVVSFLPLVVVLGFRYFSKIIKIPNTCTQVYTNLPSPPVML